MIYTEEQYKKVAAPGLKKLLGIKNDFAVPKLLKVTVNIGTGKDHKDAKFLEAAIKDVVRITGQQPIKTYAKKSISSFDVKEGDQVGIKVTLRRKMMYEFLDRLINSVLPRMRDFKGLSLKGFDKQGNYSLGMKEHTVFPEISSDEVERVHGLEVVISTSAKSRDEGKALLELIGFPFEKVEPENNK